MFKTNNNYPIKLFVCVLNSVFLFCFLLLLTTASASEINFSRSKLVQLALHLEVADQEKQYDFSRIALFEMYNTYQYELEQSFIHKPKTLKKRIKVRQWRLATQSYLESLNEYLYLMDSGLSVNFFISGQNKIFLLIGDVPVIISGPNSGADKQIENNIIEQFCLQYDCREYFTEIHRESKESSVNSNIDKVSDRDIVAHKITGKWSLRSRNQSVFTMSNGLVFSFKNIKDRKYKEIWALEIANELNRLMDYLKRTQKKGRAIGWSFLKIEELPLTDRAKKVIFNQNHDYFKLSIPFLGESPLLFDTLIPGIKSYFENSSDYRMIIDNADQYLIQK